MDGSSVEAKELHVDSNGPALIDPKRPIASGKSGRSRATATRRILHQGCETNRLVFAANRPNELRPPMPD
jgi:hypothetical protein